MQTAQIPQYSIAEYLAAERDGEIRHEFIDGELFAMVRASRTHNLLASRLTARLVDHLENTGCRVFQSDMKVWIELGVEDTLNLVSVDFSIAVRSLYRIATET